MTRVFNGERNLLSPILLPIERLIYKICGVDAKSETNWKEYTLSIILFSVVSCIVLFLLQRFQGILPFNTQELSGVDVAANTGSAFNTGVSFLTNTNWQSYTPETTMSYLTQMSGLAYQNFASAAVGIAIAIAFIRGIARKESETIGNFWVDFVRANLYILLPFCLIGALLLVSQGVVQNFNAYDTATLVDKTITVEVDKKVADGNMLTDASGENTKETQAVKTQTIAQGPVASQEAIKMWGTNGGGFFNANSAHPFENPTPLTNLLAMFAIFAISAGLTYTLGQMTGFQRHGWAVFAAMFLLTFPQLQALNIMNLKSPESAILSAVIFNAVVIICLIPLALRGVKYRPLSAEKLLQRNLMVYGLGGLVVPFIGIKIIDLIITTLGLA